MSDAASTEDEQVVAGSGDPAPPEEVPDLDGEVVLDGARAVGGRGGRGRRVPLGRGHPR
jgi:hypothetical protein